MAYAGLCHSDEHLRHETRRRTRSSAGTRAPAWCWPWARASPAWRPATTSSPASCPPAGTAGAAPPAGPTSATRARPSAPGSCPTGTWPFRLRRPGARRVLHGRRLRPALAAVSEFSCVRIDAARAAGRRGADGLQRADRLGLGGLRRAGCGPATPSSWSALGGVGVQRGAGRGARRRAARGRRRPGRDEARVRRSRWAPPTPWPSTEEAAGLARSCPAAPAPTSSS